jgi:hypothetical protein
MGAFRRLAQNLGLVYRDDGTWRPSTPAASPGKTGRETSEEVRQVSALSVWL